MNYHGALKVLQEDSEAETRELLQIRREQLMSGSYNQIRSHINNNEEGITVHASLVDVEKRFAPNTIRKFKHKYRYELIKEDLIKKCVTKIESSVNTKVKNFEDYLEAASFYLGKINENIRLDFFTPDFCERYGSTMLYDERFFIRDFTAIANGHAKARLVLELSSLKPLRHLTLKESVATATLIKIFEKLKSDFFSPDTSEEEFLSLFGRGNATISYAKIKWNSSKAALRFFVMSLSPQIIRGPKDHWKVIVERFVDMDGEPFNISSLSKGCNAGKAVIEKITAALKVVPH